MSVQEPRDLQELRIECLRDVVIEERCDDGSLQQTAISKELLLKKEIGNARLVSGDAMVWVARSTMTHQTLTDASASSTHALSIREVRVSSGRRAFVFALEMTPPHEQFLQELRVQVDGTSGVALKRKKRKIRRKMADSETAGFVPVVNTLQSPVRSFVSPSKTVRTSPAVTAQPSPQAAALPGTPTRRRLSDSTNSPARLGSPLPLSLSGSTVSDTYNNAYTSPAKSPYRSPFRKTSSRLPRTASPIVSLPGSSRTSLSPRPPRSSLSPAPGSSGRASLSPHPSRTSLSPHPSRTSLSPLPPRSGSSPAIQSPMRGSPRPREWLSPTRGVTRSGPRVRADVTPPVIRRDGDSGARTPRTDSGGERRSDSTPHSGELKSASREPRGIVNKRVRSLQQMLDDVPKDDPEHTRGATSRPPSAIRSPYFDQPVPSPARSGSSVPGSPSPLTSPSPKRLKPSGLTPRSQNTTPPRQLLQNQTALPTLPDLGPSTQSTDGAGTLPTKLTHGLLNLGNFCYMNVIIQSLAAIPDFAAHLQKDDWLVSAIQKHLGEMAKGRSLEQIRQALDEWKSHDEPNRLLIETRLAQLLMQVLEGSESSINPEPLKSAMGRKNAVFATHLQQDAHEFMLNLVNEFETELVEAVQGVREHFLNQDRAVQQQATPPPVPKRMSLLNFFRSPTPSPSPPPVSQPAVDREELISDLFPAQCFRIELFRTLTCCSCKYSRRQVETFYDFSLDLPSVAAQFPMEGSPQTSTESLSQMSPTDAKRCYCGLEAIVLPASGELQFYTCPRSACSLREAVVHGEAAVSSPFSSPRKQQEQPLPTPVTQVDQVKQSESSTVSGSHPVPLYRSIPLNEVLKKQFQPEVLELTCEKCKSGKEATAGYEVKSLPRVLVLHLKRFEVHAETGSLFKRCDAVEPPVELYPAMDINAGIAATSDDTNGNQRFVLQSVVHHIGRNIGEGHYMADVRDPRGEWRRRNDTHESVIGEDFALRASRSQESCYMLFYVQSDIVEGEDPQVDKENVLVEQVCDDQHPSVETARSDTVLTPAPAISHSSPSRNLHSLL